MYLKINITIDAFLSSKMPDVFSAARTIKAGKKPPAAVFIPCVFSAKYKDGLHNTVSAYVLEELAIGIKFATQVFQPFHYGETVQHENYWVLIRVQKAVLKVETYESAMLVTDTAVGRLVLTELIEFMHGASPAAEWSSVLYARAEQGMPRQRDGRSCGVFVCVIAEHLLIQAKLPRRMQVNMDAWRMYIGACIYHFYHQAGSAH